MRFRPPPRRREFTLRSRRKRESGAKGKLKFRRPQRRPTSRGVNLLWLIVLLILVIFLFRYFKSLGW